MSTKTTFKRVALVAVAALGLGVLSVAPSQATTIANKVTPSATTSAIKVGETATINLTVSTILTSATESLSVTGVRTKGSSGDVRLSPTTDSVSTGVKQTAAFDSTIWVDTSTAAGGAAYAVVKADFRAPAATGTYEVTFYSAGTSAGTAITPFTWTITVTADSKLSDSTSTSFIANGQWTKLVDADDTAVGSKATDATIAATIKVTQKNATASATEAMQIYVTGPGFVTAGGSDTTTARTRVTTRVASATAPAVGGSTYFGVWSDGTAGEATVTVVGADSGLVLASKKVTFSDTKPASASAVVKKAYIAAGATTTNVFAVTVKDAAGNAITGTSVTVTGARSDTTTAGVALASAALSFTWNSTDKVYYADVTGASTAKFGVAGYTISVKGTDAAETVVTTTASTTFADVIATSVTITAPATAAIGDKVTYTLTAKEKNGYPIADGSYEGGTGNGSRGIFWNTTTVPVYTSTSVKPFNAGETITTVSGVATVDIYMPVAAGSVGATWTLAGAATAPIGAIDKTIGGTTVTVATTVTNPGVDAASDAANEATDAANAATDAALAAADAADAATAAAEDASAAVAKLAKSVNTALKALKKQITALTALVNKLLK